jgi:hypothetical protein
MGDYSYFVWFMPIDKVMNSVQPGRPFVALGNRFSFPVNATAELDLSEGDSV